MRFNMDVRSRIGDLVLLIDFVLHRLVDCLDPLLRSSLLLERFGAVERGFEGVRVQDADFFEKDDTSSRLLVFLERHFAIAGVEDGAKVVGVLWDGPDDLVRQSRTDFVSIDFASILENVEVATVTMHVAREDHAARVGVMLHSQLVAEANEGFGVVDGWMQVSTWVLPPTVKVYSEE